MEKTSWSKSSKWYGKIVGRHGHYYHQNSVLPAVVKMLELKSDSRLVDFGCGQGVLARKINPEVEYLGVDVSRSLIQQAKSLDTNSRHRYLVGDVTKQLEINRSYFSHLTFILSLQNMRDQDIAIKRAAESLTHNGVMLLVLNHPCFRIPRQSGWAVDPDNQLQRRWINKYMSHLEIPITTHPSTANSPVTWSFHQPLSDYFKSLAGAGLMVQSVEELVSDKESSGRAAKMENRSRAEIPLFLIIKAVKQAGN